MGAWSYVQPRIATALKHLSKKEATFVGRPASAAPATGNPAIHQAEVIPPPPPPAPSARQ